MPFTLIHGLISLLFVSLFTKDKHFWLLAFFAGVMPDLDGVPILFDMKLYYAIHHELLHPAIYGVFFGIIFAIALNRLFKIETKGTFAVFTVGYILHPLTDVIFTNWPVKLLWPLSNEQFSLPVFMAYNVELAIVVLLLSMMVIAKGFFFHKRD